MRFCSKCGAQVASSDRFCPYCGVQIVIPTQEAAEQPYVVPESSVSIVVSTKDKVLGFVGMGLSISGLFLAVVGLLYTLIGISMEGLGFGFSIGFSMFSLPLCIVGNSLCKKSRQAGNPSNACSVGRKLGIAGIIVSCAMLFFGLVNLMI